jgi:hypothetical protein
MGEHVRGDRDGVVDGWGWCGGGAGLRMGGDDAMVAGNGIFRRGQSWEWGGGWVRGGDGATVAALKPRGMGSSGGGTRGGRRRESEDGVAARGGLPMERMRDLGHRGGGGSGIGECGRAVRGRQGRRRVGGGRGRHGGGTVMLVDALVVPLSIVEIVQCWCVVTIYKL